jgi:hypothetical protein
MARIVSVQCLYIAQVQVSSLRFSSFQPLPLNLPPPATWPKDHGMGNWKKVRSRVSSRQERSSVSIKCKIQMPTILSQEPFDQDSGSVDNSQLMSGVQDRNQ